MAGPEQWLVVVAMDDALFSVARVDRLWQTGNAEVAIVDEDRYRNTGLAPLYRSASLPTPG